MKIEKTWRANLKPYDSERGEKLVDIAGRWGIGIEVRITKPYTYSRGPVERRLIIGNRESLPSPTNE